MSEVQGIVKLIDLVLTASTGWTEYTQAMERAKSKLEQVRMEGRDVTDEELDEAQADLDTAIEAERRKIHEARHRA